MKCLLNCKGRKFKAEIMGNYAKGTIQVEGLTVYLCQNERDGSDCRDKLGYRFSWRVNYGTADDLEREDVYYFSIIDDE